MLALLAAAVLGIAQPQETDIHSAIASSVGIWLEAHPVVERQQAPVRRGWSVRKTAIYYGALYGGDVITTHVAIKYRHCGEENPLPGMGSDLGRIAWSAGITAGLTTLDRQLVLHHHARWAWALRIITAIAEGLNMAKGLGISPIGSLDWMPRSMQRR